MYNKHFLAKQWDFECGHFVLILKNSGISEQMLNNRQFYVIFIWNLLVIFLKGKQQTAHVILSKSVKITV